MVLSKPKIYIFDRLIAMIKNLCDLITVNYIIIKRLRTISAILICCLISASAFAQYRSIDGTGNHSNNLGSTDAPLSRITEIAYGDSISTIGATDRMNPRIISNTIFSQTDRLDNSLNLSDYVWAFGQFLDHDISLVKDNTNEPAFIEVVDHEEEQHFEVGTNIVMSRSDEAPGTGTDVDNPRNYLNSVTSFIDGSSIYGSTVERAEWLRDENSNIGKLKVSSGNLLPWNTDTGQLSGSTDDVNIPEMDDIGIYTNNRHFVAGDVRANENPLLISLHTIFVREHNRLCEEIKEANPGWSSDKIYFEARKKVGAYLQSIAYYEWLPSQGVYLPTYNGYNSNVDPSISNVFSAAAFRMGHTLINSSIIRMTDEGEEMQTGSVSLKDAYFNPTLIHSAGGIEPYLKGMATNLQQDFDCKMIDDLRNFLFSSNPSASFGLDLAAINIHRGRERGLPDYNTVRYNFGLPKINNFISLTGESESAQLLEDVYGDVNNIDPWVGMLAEQHETDALVGKLVMTIMERQFQFLRDGDQFYFENDPSFSDEEIHEIKHIKLHDIIMRNTTITLMQYEVFEAMPHEAIPNGPSLLPLQLEASVYPNPTDKMINIKYFMELADPITVSLYDSNGQLLSTRRFQSKIGDNFIQMDLNEEYPRGIYNVKIETERNFRILRVVKR